MEATETPTSLSLRRITETASQLATRSAAEQRLDEAAYEALGILEVMHEHGNIPPLYRDLCATVIAKYQLARRDMNRERS